MPVVLPLALFSLLCPPAVQYFFSLLILCWLLRQVGLRWRKAIGSLPEPLRKFITLVFQGTLAFVGTALVSSLLAGTVGNFELEPLQILAPYTHLFLKRSFVWIVLALGVGLSYQRGWRLQQA